MNRSFVDNIEAGNNIEAENVFKNEIADKVGAALEVKRKELANTFLRNHEAEKNDVWFYL